MCLMKLFQLPSLHDSERSDSITKRFFCNTESSAISWYRAFIYVEDLRCKYDKAGRITLSLTKCRRRYFPKFSASFRELHLLNYRRYCDTQNTAFVLERKLNHFSSRDVNVTLMLLMLS